MTSAITGITATPSDRQAEDREQVLVDDPHRTVHASGRRAHHASVRRLRERSANTASPVMRVRVGVVRSVVPTRSAFHQSLDELWRRMAALAERDAVAIERASLALLDANRQLAELVISEAGDIAELAVELEDRSAELMVRQQPVAGDLRLVLSTVPISAALGRMGGLAQHVAQTTRMRAPQHAVMDEMRDVFAAMGQAAVRAATDLASVIRDRDAGGAIALQEADAVMDGLHRRLFTQALAPDWPHGIEPAVDAALLGRFYERFADQAVSVARRVHYIVTGTYPPGGQDATNRRYPRSARVRLANH